MDRNTQQTPLLLVDVDGVISLWGWSPGGRPTGSFLTVDGIVHFISERAGDHLLRLAEVFELTWCTGWEDKANEYLPNALGLPSPLPYVSFDRTPAPGGAHWKLAAIDHHAGSHRPLAWIDDSLDERCQAWATARPGPTLLVHTDPSAGITIEQVDRLEAWAAALEQAA